MGARPSFQKDYPILKGSNTKDMHIVTNYTPAAKVYKIVDF